MPGRFLATLAGVAFAVASLMILLDKQLLEPWNWTSAQWLTILMVFGVIAAGELLVTAWKAGNGWSALGFGVLFVVGTGLVVYSSVGRQVETAGTTTLSVEDVNKKIVDKSAELEAAKQRRDYAELQVQKTMTKSYCGRGCKDWKQNAKDVGVVVKQLEVEIAALGPQKPVNAQAEAMADILLLFPYVHVTKAQIVAVLTLLVPFSKTLFFEIGSIVSLGFAFRPRPLPKTFSEIKEESLKKVERSPLADMFSGEQPDPTPPKGGRKSMKKRFPENVVPISRGKHPVERALEKNGGAVSSNRELANLLSVSDGEASKSWREIEDRLIVTRTGKHVRLALRA